MKEDKDILSDIFGNKLTDYKATPSPDQWEKINKDLRKKRFLRFGFAYFNIYYLILTIGVSGLIFYLVWNNMSDDNVQKLDSVKINTTTITLDTSRHSPDLLKEKEMIPTSKENQKKNTLNKPTHSSIQDTMPVSIQKNVPIINEPTHKPDTLTEVKVKPKEEDKKSSPPKISTARKDTIIQIDTIRVRKRKKQK